MKVLLTFHTIYDNLKAEEVLLSEGLKIKVKPVPRDISSDCGLSIEGTFEDKVNIIDILKKREVEFDNIYTVE